MPACRYLVEKLLNRVFLSRVQIVLDLARILPQINALRQHLAQNLILLELLEVVCRGGGREGSGWSVSVVLSSAKSSTQGET